MSRFLDDVARKLAPRIVAAVAADPLAFARQLVVRDLITWLFITLLAAALGAVVIW